MVLGRGTLARSIGWCGKQNREVFNSWRHFACLWRMANCISLRRHHSTELMMTSHVALKGALMKGQWSKGSPIMIQFLRSDPYILSITFNRRCSFNRFHPVFSPFGRRPPKSGADVFDSSFAWISLFWKGKCFRWKNYFQFVYWISEMQLVS